MDGGIVPDSDSWTAGSPDNAATSMAWPEAGLLPLGGEEKVNDNSADRGSTDVSVEDVT